MKIFLVCLLAVGALAGDAKKESTGKKQEKRGLLSGQLAYNTYNGQQLLSNAYGPSYVGYQPTAYTTGLGSGISGYTSGLGSGISGYSSGLGSGISGYSSGLGSGISGYSSGLGYAASSLPVYQKSYTTGSYINGHLGGQNTIYRAGLGSLQSYGLSQLGRETYTENSQPIQSRVISRTVNVPVSVPHPVPVERTVQVPVPHPVPVEVRRPVEVRVPKPVPVYVNKPYAVHVDRPVPVPVPQPIEVPHPVPVQVPVPHPVPVQVSVPHPVHVQVPVAHPVPVEVSHQEPVHIGSYGEQHVGQDVVVGGGSYGQDQLGGQGAIYENSLSTLGGHQQLNVDTQHYNLGGAALDTGYQSTYNTAVYQQQPSYELSSGSQSLSSGYHYEKPVRKFNF